MAVPAGFRVSPAAGFLLSNNPSLSIEAISKSAHGHSPSGHQTIITKADVLAALGLAPAPAAPVKAAPAAAAPAPHVAPAVQAAAAPAAGGGGGIERRNLHHKTHRTFVDTPASQMRKIIAKRLMESKNGLPHAYMCIEVEMDALMATRKACNEAFGSKISVNDLVIKAVASTLKAVPEANAFWTEDAITFNSTIDVAFAAATPGGLITPVVRDANTKSLLEVSAAAKDMAGRARENKLMPEEFAGGCSSVSNLGMFDISQFVAVLNPPQSTIFAVGSTTAKAFPDGKGGVVAKHVMRMTLSHDARVIDDALAEKVCAAFRDRIETPALMFQ